MQGNVTIQRNRNNLYRDQNKSTVQTGHKEIETHFLQNKLRPQRERDTMQDKTGPERERDTFMLDKVKPQKERHFMQDKVRPQRERERDFMQDKVRPHRETLYAGQREATQRDTYAGQSNA